MLQRKLKVSRSTLLNLPKIMSKISDYYLEEIEEEYYLNEESRSKCETFFMGEAEDEPVNE